MSSNRYDIEILPKAKKDIKDLKQHAERALQEILRLENNPQLGHSLTGSLKGTRSLEFNLKGGGAYRAIYTVVDTNRICVVFLVGPHENIYKVAERRWEAVRKQLEP